MSTLDDALVGKFRRLLDDVPDDYTLPQWQLAYRQVMVHMGTKILGRFANDVAKQGHPAQPLSGGQGSGGHPNNPPPGQTAAVVQPSPARPLTGGQGPGGHPNDPCDFLELPSFVLRVHAAAGETPKE